MSPRKRDDQEWSDKWEGRANIPGFGQYQANGSISRPSEVSNPRYQRIRAALPENFKVPFDRYIHSLCQKTPITQLYQVILNELSQPEQSLFIDYVTYLQRRS